MRGMIFEKAAIKDFGDFPIPVFLIFRSLFQQNIVHDRPEAQAVLSG
jgi:hypothetical protein